MKKSRRASQPVDRRIPPTTSGQAGFTLAEMAISLFILAEVLIGVLLLFDLNNKVTRVQTNISEMQQSLRVGQYDMVKMLRMTGRGALPASQGAFAPGADLYPGRAVSIRNDAQIGDTISTTNGATPPVLTGTDVLTVRGVFSSPIYRVNFEDPTAGAFTFGGASGAITVEGKTRWNFTQDLEPLKDAIRNGIPEALIIVSSRTDSVFAVVELNPGASAIDDTANEVRVAFRASGGSHTTQYIGLSPAGAFPPTLDGVAFIGILEEYRYYIRDEFAVPGDPTTERSPRLSRARVFPNTEIPYRGDVANWSQDIADNIVDLQVALGMAPAGVGGALTESVDGNGDSWLFNGPGDNATAPPGVNVFYARVTAMARTDRADPKYVAPFINRLEDRTYTAADLLNSAVERMRRRRLLQTVVDLRSL
jgi:hypothetical protein